MCFVIIYTTLGYFIIAKLIIILSIVKKKRKKNNVSNIIDRYMLPTVIIICVLQDYL